MIISDSSAIKFVDTHSSIYKDRNGVYLLAREKEMRPFIFILDER